MTIGVTWWFETFDHSTNRSFNFRFIRELLFLKELRWCECVTWLLEIYWFQIRDTVSDYLELGPTVESNRLWTKEAMQSLCIEHRANPFWSLYPSEMYPALRLKKDASRCSGYTPSWLNQKRVYLTWRTAGTLPDGSVYANSSWSISILLHSNERDPLPLKVPSVMITNDWILQVASRSRPTNADLIIWLVKWPIISFREPSK